MPAQYKGLSTTEAHQLLKKFGRNVLPSKSKISWSQLVIRQFKSLLILLLIIAAVLSMALGEHLDGVFILLIILLNALLGFVQEYKAENAIASLQTMTVSDIIVVRDGKRKEIPSTSLVPEDIIELSEGDKIPADCILLSSNTFEVNEASLTGESLPVAKNPSSNSYNELFSGTIVTKGRGIAQVIKTGENTKIGKMAASLSDIDDQDTPLANKVNKLAKLLTLIAIIITTLLFLIGVIQNREWLDMALTSISLAVAAVPEGLPAVITITLAVGLQRMAKKRSILRRMGAIEALGNTTTIATDKTGTLTENKMKVVSVYFDYESHTASTLKNTQYTTFYKLITSGIYNNDASLSLTEHGSYEVLGDQTEGSILLYAQELGLDPELIKQEADLIEEYLFDSTSKRMTSVWKLNNTYSVYTKGAPEVVLPLCSHVYSNGRKTKLTFEQKKEITVAYQNMAKKGLRVLALSYKDIKSHTKNRERAEKDMQFLGLVGIADPPRESVKEVIRTAHAAGIRTIMVTGDSPLTASYIAEKTGISYNHDLVVTGKQLSSMSDAELERKIDEIAVFARVSPDDKLRIVKALQAKKELVAVTGDGVNDALALKQADVGVAMGITGSDVAKEVADMIITDDNYISIVEAIRQGRIIFENIVKSVTYLISSNLGEILTIFVAVLVGLPAPLLPVHILWVNLVTDGLPALSLAMDPESAHNMQKRSSPTTSLIGSDQYRTIGVVSTIIAACTLSAFITAHRVYSVEVARTIAFSVLVLVQLIIVFFIRKGQSPLSNKYLLATVTITLVLQVIVLSTEPFVSLFEIQLP